MTGPQMLIREVTSTTYSRDLEYLTFIMICHWTPKLVVRPEHVVALRDGFEGYPNLQYVSLCGQVGLDEWVGPANVEADMFAPRPQPLSIRVNPQAGEVATEDIRYDDWRKTASRVAPSSA